MLDIHCHILPGIDDGAENVGVSLILLRMMRDQGFTNVIATPHFYPLRQDIKEYKANRKRAYIELKNAMKNENLPKIGIGSEILYFKGIGRCEGLYDLTLCNSRYVLIEFADCEITNDMINDIGNIRGNLGLIPIMAHIERYAHSKGYKKLLNFIGDGEAFAQINASSLIDSYYRKTVLKLIKHGYVSFVATDSHSPDKRPPQMDAALREIENKFGRATKNMFIDNSNQLCEEIFHLPVI